MIFNALTIDQVKSAWWLYAIGAFVTLFIISGCLFFARKAKNRSKEIGMDQENIKKAIVSSVSFSILPSIGIFIGVITMSGLLGVALPWIRLSVLGALHYELLAVGQAAEGVTAATMTVQDFVTIAFTMTIAIIWGSLFTLFFFKRYQEKIVNRPKKENKRSFSGFIFQSVFIGLVSAYFGGAFARIFLDNSSQSVIDHELTQTVVPLVVFVVSYLTMMLCDYLVNKKNVKWLESFQLSFSMLIGMASAVLLATGGVF